MSFYIGIHIQVRQKEKLENLSEVFVQQELMIMTVSRREKEGKVKVGGTLKITWTMKVPNANTVVTHLRQRQGKFEENLVLTL